MKVLYLGPNAITLRAVLQHTHGVSSRVVIDVERDVARMWRVHVRKAG